ncbi:MAG: hypothetical protein M1826_000087 [Phylliscum demangeonii]|nr:MAG: hypothetical protein M1826_000087 [Phylliscum demangeonii]
MRTKFGYTTRESFQRMTNDDAQAIQQVLAELEFPTVFEKALQFALFRTYGIETVASLLVATKQLSSDANVTKRFADTVVLIEEFMSHRPTADRTLRSIARMNYLHGLYQKQGLISNDNMLYTLSLFAAEPARWIQQYEWRELNEMELCAVGTFWKSMGDAMEIRYDGLPSAASGWRDGLQWLEEIKDWSVAYEIRYLLPNPDSRKTADFTMALLLWHLPRGLRDVGVKAATVLMDDRLRRSMLYDAPPFMYTVVLGSMLQLRKWFLRYLALPRPELFRVRHVAAAADATTGRYHYGTWTAHPWYVSTKARWTFDGWLTRLLPNGVLPGDDGDRYASDGYRIEDVGPRAMLGKGADTMLAGKKKLQTERSSGCPFAFS